ncbi:MAG: hypothetical protein AB1486_03815 [Planctomycetota bacterium]
MNSTPSCHRVLDGRIEVHLGSRFRSKVLPRGLLRRLRAHFRGLAHVCRSAEADRVVILYSTQSVRQEDLLRAALAWRLGVPVRRGERSAARFRRRALRMTSAGRGGPDGRRRPTDATARPSGESCSTGLLDGRVELLLGDLLGEALPLESSALPRPAKDLVPV